MSDPPYILHVWPSQWGLQSLEPACLAAVMFLQLAMPGKFQVAECSNPDISPNGLLPFLTHGHLVFASLPAIIAFVASLSRSRTSGASNLDASLSAVEKAQRTAWWSHVESHLGDLVSHVFFGADANFWGLTRPTLARAMPAPQRYYVPRRIREAYRPRLEAGGLWSLPAIEREESPFAKEKKREDHKDVFARVFEQGRITEKARTAFGVHARLLGGKEFIYKDRSTSLDVYLAAHVLLLATPPFPHSVLQALLFENYPTLVEHARRVQAEVARAPPYQIVTPPSPSILSLVPRSWSLSTKPSKEAKPPNADDVQFRRMRWAWMVFALGAAAYHIAQFSRYVVIVREGGNEDQDAAEEDETPEEEALGEEEEEEEDLGDTPDEFSET